MNFIARAGGMLDSAWRLAGILMILLVVVLFLLMQSLSTNRELNNDLEQIRSRMNVYVVPGGEGGVYAPNKAELLIQTFSDYMTQSILTYTYYNLEKQYKEVRKFLDARLETRMAPLFRELVGRSAADQRSSLFIPDRTKLTFKELNSEDGRGKLYEVVVVGDQRYLIAGREVSKEPIRVKMRLRQRLPSKNNPFGFIVESYKQTVAKDK